MKMVLIIIACILTPLVLIAQPRVYDAKKTDHPPKIDGKLEDSCWLTIEATKDFLTNEPVFGKPATQKTEVKVLYDNDALYLAYYMFDDEPSKIIKILTERDKTVIADEIILGIDPYNEKTLAFRFQVSASGVQTERLQSSFIPNTDRSWDVVWESKVSTDDKGWYAEIKIPFAAIRFPKKSKQEWTIQFGRFVGRTGEFTTWSPVNPNIGGGAMRQWGLLRGIENVKPATRLSISPYFTIGMQSQPSIKKLFYAGGADLKYGISQSYTLDMSLVPDFSQVQSDNTVLNLSPFEVRYDERRQFFTEGADLFNKAGIFYSRRIGNIPAGYALLAGKLKAYERIVDNPPVTGLINAFKLSGRNSKGFGLGMLNAVTKNMYATIINDSSGEKRKILTEPLANYNVLVIDQALKNNSRIGLINTNVLRKGNNVNANVSALDFVFNTKGNIYSLLGTAVYSSRKGTSLANGKQQGYNYRIGFAKVSRNFRYEISSRAVHKDFNPNDLGIWGQTNYMANLAAIKYYSFIPKGRILNWNSILSYTHSNILEGLKFQRSDVDFSAFVLFKDFSTISLLVNWVPKGIRDIYEPRVNGRYYNQPGSFGSSLSFATDSRKRSQIKINAAIRDFNYPKKHIYYSAGVNPSMRLGNKLMISASASLLKEKNNQGFVTVINSDSIVFGRRTERTIEKIIQVQYFFSPYSNLSLRARDYSTKIKYNDFYKLSRDGSLEFFTYLKNPDIDLNLFNVDLIYTWQFSAGSFLSLSWKNNVMNASHQNSLSIRIIYYLDYLKIREFF